jgi:uncharacterized membrane protein YhaH (DUF805 family)
MAVLPPRPLPPPGARLARGPFALAAIALYAISFVSQALLTAPVTKHVSVAPFVLAQIVVIWLWVEIHRRRLRDAGRPTGIAIGIAMVYALEVILLALLIWALTASAAQTGDTASIFHLYVLLYMLGSISGESSLASLQYYLMSVAAVMFIPTAIAIVFSLWTATRPSAISAS